MVDPIRIDQLPAVASPTLSHEFPVMLGGFAFRLKIQQVATLVQAILVDAAPLTLDTLNELAAALGDDPNFATTTAAALAGKQPLSAVLTGTEESFTTTLKDKLESVDILSGFRNKLINGNFDIWQRGTSLSNAGYLADRWQVGGGGAGYAYTQSRQAVSLGDVDATYCMQLVQTAGAVGANFLEKIEDVRTFAGKKVTVTVWAKNGGNNPNIGVRLDQEFGSGGSSTVFGAVITKAITTGFGRYDFVIDVHSITGKTVGAGSCLTLYIFNAPGSPNTYPSTLQFTRCSVVEGDATNDTDPFAARHIQQEEALCYRYYQTHHIVIEGSTYNQTFTLQGKMRTAPTITGGGTGYTTLASSPSTVTHYQTARAFQTIKFDAEM